MLKKQSYGQVIGVVTNMSRVIVNIIVVVLGICSAANSASFDCKRATTKIEKVICSDIGVSALDDELANLYARALVVAPDPETLKREQRNWIRRERNVCLDARSLRITYQVRIKDIKEQIRYAKVRLSDQDLIGRWEELKSSVDGPFDLLINAWGLSFQLCNMVFDLKSSINNEHVFEARKKNTCFPYSLQSPVNIIKITKNRYGGIRLMYYSGENENTFSGSETYFRLE